MTTATKRALAVLAAAGLVAGCGPREKPADRPRPSPAGAKVLRAALHALQSALIEHDGADRFCES